MRYSGGYSSRSQTISIVYDGTTESYKFNFPYNKQLIEIIKSTVPANMRSYDPTDNHAWYISTTGGNDKYADGLIALLHATFPSATFFEYTKAKYEEQNRATNTSTTVSCESLFQQLCTLASNYGAAFTKGEELGTATKVYRKLALHLHPDRNGGDGSKMSELNSIWAALKEQKFFKEGV